jgi:hypothetical protein
MSVSVAMPRHSPMLPGGESRVRSRYPPSLASLVRKSPTVFFRIGSLTGIRCSSSVISISVKTNFAGSSGDTRLTWHSHNTRHARMHRIAIRLAKVWTMVDFVQLLEREENLLGGRLTNYKPNPKKRAG